MRLELLVKLHLNTAYCALKEGLTEKATAACRQALGILDIRIHREPLYIQLKGTEA
jgi:hypothetical protein